MSRSARRVRGWRNARPRRRRWRSFPGRPRPCRRRNEESRVSGTIQQLVSEVAQITGSPLPAVMDADAPVLRDESKPFYLVGLIGGKEVGKSALVNALVGQPISESTSYGPGTEEVVAYVHQDQAGAVGALLGREAPGRHRIVTHSIARLRRQVLLDLPDIDSVYSD